MTQLNLTKEVKYCELILKPCAHTYGGSPCGAAIGTTGKFKCYNSPRTCQDPSNYLEGDEQIIRWAEPTADLPIDIEAIPCISGSVSRRPQVVDPGESLGTRETVSVSMNNFRHNDSGFDKYISDRGYNTYNKGTYWGKFAARWGNLEGYEFRTVDGFVGQSIDDMTRRYYVIDSTAGPDSNGRYSITAKDVVTLLNSDTAQWPLPSSGTLRVAISETDTDLYLNPVGIGNLEYPNSGIASIGDEKVSYTRVGDIVTLTGRGLSSSSLDGHDEGETFQAAAVYSGLSPAEIFLDLILNATEVPTEYTDFSAWETECDDFLGRLYSAEIMNPTSVKTLLEEVVREAGLVVYTNLITKKITLRVLRQEVPQASVDDNVILAGSCSSKKLDSKRVSSAWIYYGKKNPLEKQSEQQNYSAIYAKQTGDSVVALENSPPSIRAIESRWISLANGDAAISIAERLIARYQNTPRQVSLKVPARYNLELGSQITVQSRIFEDSQGDPEDPILCQITSIDEGEGLYSAILEEVQFGTIDPPDPALRMITINADTYNINLREAHDLIYTEIEPGQTVRLFIGGTVNIGSEDSDLPSLVIGDWPAGVTVEIDGTGRIQGKGGDGGVSNSKQGEKGSDSIYTRYPVTIIGDIEIYGGGGGGAWGTNGSDTSGGGGGAGFNGGLPGGTREEGFDITDSEDVNQGNGGDPGQSGGGGLDTDASIILGGTAGAAINGSSYVTITSSPTIKGSEIN